MIDTFGFALSIFKGSIFVIELKLMRMNSSPMRMNAPREPISPDKRAA